MPGKDFDLEAGGGGNAPKAVPEDTSEVGEDGVPLNPGVHPGGVQFLPAAGYPGNGDAKVDLGSPTAAGTVPHFVGLGKEELMKYANDPFWVRLRWLLFILFWVIWLGMLAGAIIIIVFAPKCSTISKGSAKVIENGPYYQIYLSSFSKDQKLSGLEQEVQYFKDLGVKTVIISQILETPNEQVTSQGQSVPDRMTQVYNWGNVDKFYGTLENFKGIVTKIKEKGLQVLLQFIPNHVSFKHPWFRTNPEYFVLKPGAEVQGPKSSWTSVYGRPAWAAVDESAGTSGNFYLHQFKEDEADLNYQNSKLIKEMNLVFKNWTQTGINGFLFSDVSYLVENLEDLTNPNATKNQKKNKDVLNKFLDTYSWKLEGAPSPYALLDVDGLSDPEAIDQYSGPDMTPVLASFANLPPNFNARDIEGKVNVSAGQFVIRRLSSPRLERPASRYNEKADVLAMITFMLKGEVVLYYGDEVGLKSGNRGPTSSTLDISVDPMPQNRDPQRLAFYKELISLHNSLNQSVENTGGSTKWHVTDNIYSFMRETSVKYVVVTNVGSSGRETVDVQTAFGVPGEAQVRSLTPGFGDYTLGQMIPTHNVTLPPSTGLILGIGTPGTPIQA